MSLLNIGLQCIGLMRAKMSPEDEALLKKANSTSAVREAAVKAPALKQAVLESVRSTKQLVQDILERLQLHDKAVKTCPAATDTEMDELWSLMQDVDSRVQRSDTTQGALMKHKAL